MHSLLEYITIPTARVAKGGKFGPYQMEKHPETRSTDYTANGTTEACIMMLEEEGHTKDHNANKIEKSQIFSQMTAAACYDNSRHFFLQRFIFSPVAFLNIFKL